MGCHNNERFRDEHCTYGKVLPIDYFIHQRKLPYWNRLFTSDNSVLFSLSRLVSQRFVAIGCL